MTFYDRTYRLGFGGGLTVAVKYLLIANVALFLVKILADMMFSGGQAFINNTFGMTPGQIFSHFPIWQFFTYMFLHGSIGHIGFNMFALWMFGTELEYNWGSKDFLKYYLICGVGGGVLVWSALYQVLRYDHIVENFSVWICCLFAHPKSKPRE